MLETFTYLLDKERKVTFASSGNFRHLMRDIRKQIAISELRNPNDSVFDLDIGGLLVTTAVSNN
jgi:hypothetical protein